MNKKTILITGCSTGFGHLFVREYLDLGYHVIASMRNASERSSLFQDLSPSLKKNLTLVNFDVTNSEDRIKLVHLIENEFNGKLDILINNAGVALFGPFENSSENQIRQMMEVNFFGTILLTKELLPFLRKNKSKIINISSILGLTGTPMNSVYSASKFAIEGIMESLRFELKPHGVQVMIVEPGGHRTNFAKNAQWSDPPLSSSENPYKNQLTSFKNLFEKMKKGKGTPALAVVKKIIAVAERRQLPLRMQCGKDAHFLWSIKKFLPDTFSEKIFSFLFSKLFKN